VRENMKFIKILVIAVLAVALSACGDHGYEGTYQSEVTSKGFGSMAGMMPKTTLTIGSDYIEQNGKRVEMDEIFVRVNNDRQYLVFKSSTNREEAMEIFDDGSLGQDLGMAKIKFVPVD